MTVQLSKRMLSVPTVKKAFLKKRENYRYPKFFERVLLEDNPRITPEWISFRLKMSGVTVSKSTIYNYAKILRGLDE
jgi:hypothetical protein